MGEKNVQWEASAAVETTDEPWFEGGGGGQQLTERAGDRTWSSAVSAVSSSRTSSASPVLGATLRPAVGRQVLIPQRPSDVMHDDAEDDDSYPQHWSLLSEPHAGRHSVPGVPSDVESPHLGDHSPLHRASSWARSRDDFDATENDDFLPPVAHFTSTPDEVAVDVLPPTGLVQASSAFPPPFPQLPVTDESLPPAAALAAPVAALPAAPAGPPPISAALPVTEQPVTDLPVLEQPVTEQPVTEQPVTEQPSPEPPPLSRRARRAAEAARLAASAPPAESPSPLAEDAARLAEPPAWPAESHQDAWLPRRSEPDTAPDRGSSTPDLVADPFGDDVDLHDEVLIAPVLDTSPTRSHPIRLAPPRQVDAFEDRTEEPVDEVAEPVTGRDTSSERLSSGEPSVDDSSWDVRPSNDPPSIHFRAFQRQEEPAVVTTSSIPAIKPQVSVRRPDEPFEDTEHTTVVRRVEASPAAAAAQALFTTPASGKQSRPAGTDPAAVGPDAPWGMPASANVTPSDALAPQVPSAPPVNLAIPPAAAAMPRPVSPKSSTAEEPDGAERRFRSTVTVTMPAVPAGMPPLPGGPSTSAFPADHSRDPDDDLSPDHGGTVSAPSGSVGWGSPGAGGSPATWPGDLAVDPGRPASTVVPRRGRGVAKKARQDRKLFKGASAQVPAPAAGPAALSDIPAPVAVPEPGPQPGPVAGPVGALDEGDRSRLLSMIVFWAPAVVLLLLAAVVVWAVR
jgi:hypothetical protein